MKASSRLAAPRASISFCGASQASTLPACISEMRSQRIPSFMKCVVTKIVTPCLRDRSISSSQKLSRATGSTPEVGSSRIRICGSCRTATASESRWRRPIGRSSASASRCGAEAESLDQLRRCAPSPSPAGGDRGARAGPGSGGRSARRRARTPASCSRGSCAPPCCRLRRSCRRASRSLRWAAAGPVSIFMVVDLPQPLEPRKPKISPRSIDSVTWSTAVKLPKRRVRPWASMAISALPAARGGIVELRVAACASLRAAAR